MTNTSNYAWNKPTNGADQDAWGTELNDTLDDIDAQMKVVENKADAAQTDVDAVDARTTTLEAKVQQGFANWPTASARYFYGDTCQGFEYERWSIAGQLIAVPFSQPGTYGSIGYYGEHTQGSTFLGIYDTQEDGGPGERLVSAPYVGGYGEGDTTISFTPITITRPCWLFIFTNGYVRLRGTTGIAPPQVLGLSTHNPTGVSDVPTCIYAASHSSGTPPDPAPSTWTAPVYASTTGWAPGLYLRNG